MAAVASVSNSWIPEDDLLLKNAVEAGASLQALAKGAVQFSRRYTFRELRDRWHSLLYDPEISAQASSCMFELEHSTSNPSSKFSKSENHKETKEALEKRKVGSIRKQYYAMRKRIRNEFSRPADLDFFAEPNLHECSGHGGELREHVALDSEAPDGDCMLGDCISNQFGLQEADFDIPRHAFLETMRDITATTAVEDDHPDRIVSEDCLYEFSENASSLVGNDGKGSFEPSNKHRDMPHNLENKLVNIGKCSGVEEVGPSQELSSRKLCDSHDYGAKQLSTFDSINDNPQNVSSEFGGRPHLNSPDADGSASLHILGFSSPRPRLPLWKTVEYVSAPAMPMPVNVSHEDTNNGAEETLAPPDYGNRGEKSPSGYHVHSEPMLRDRHNGDGLISSAATSEGEFADLSDAFLDLSNEDEVTDKSCYDNLNRLPLSSPNDVQEDDLKNVEPKTLMVSNIGPQTPTDACSAEPKDTASSVQGDQQSVCHSKVNEPATSVLKPDPPDLSNGSTFCTLNTEDTEIPCNDDIFLLIHPATSFAASATQPVITYSPELACSSANHRSNEQGINLGRKGQDPRRCFTRTQMVVPDFSPAIMPGNPLVGCAVKSKLPDSSSLTLLPIDANKALGDPNQGRLVYATSNATKDEVLSQDATKVTDVPATYREVQLHEEAGSVKMTLPESLVDPSASDQEEYESDDVPDFTDIEAMILEMDLGPNDQSSYSSKQVSRYQHEDSKRTIIRLEQCARSSFQRTMTSQGALAILYGRHLKHYIRKTEVILGRSTVDVDVDIDLRKEGPANKISRRQATIKMETNGSFLLKNLGKSLISVNGKAVATGQLLTLISNCLIEIRGMSFVFEINHKYVRQYLDNTAKKSQGKNTNFEWSPKQEP